MKKPGQTYRVRDVRLPTTSSTQIDKNKLESQEKNSESGITVQVAQGLGDIFWVYQKLAPYFDRINFRICVATADPVSCRSAGWLKLLPKVGYVDIKTYIGDEYDRMASGKFYVNDIVKQWDSGIKEVKYCCNKFLEDGIRIDEIDEYRVETDVPIRIQTFDIGFDEFITLYVSGGSKTAYTASLGVWTTDNWLQLIDSIYKKFNIDLPIVQIGANFDLDVMNEIENKLNSKNIPSKKYVQQSPDKVCYILEKTKLFLGYQSGLNVIADNLDTKQIMLYFKHLEKMQYTWCKQKNIKTAFFSDLFTSTPEQVVNNIKGLQI